MAGRACSSLKRCRSWLVCLCWGLVGVCWPRALRNWQFYSVVWAEEALGTCVSLGGGSSALGARLDSSGFCALTGLIGRDVKPLVCG